jgi:phosphoribosylanthranilate isomerase
MNHKKQDSQINRLRVKVCGMRDKENIIQLVQLPIDYIGFIFYSGSPRYAGTKIEPSILRNIPSHIQKVGVFVNSTIEETSNIANENDIEILQLHGNETPEYCNELSEKGFTIIKSFSIKNYDISKKITDYRFSCNYYLFDAPTKEYGGSGQKFDWKILEQQKIYLPFFLSGGIAPGDEEIIKNLNIDGLHAIDLNSRFEIEPGIKNIELIKNFIEKIKKQGS